MLLLTFCFALVFASLDIAFSWIVAKILFNWWLPLFARQTDFSDRGVVKTGCKLPWWLTWFDTFDADLDQGVRDGSITGPSVYWNRVAWLNRNCGYGFSYWVLGIEFAPANWRVIRADDKVFLAVANNYFSLHIKNFLGVQFKFGWKAWNDFNLATQQWPTQPWGPTWRLPFVFSISFAKGVPTTA